MPDPATSQAPRILVVDDNPAIHADFRKIFRGNREAEALAAATANLFDDVPGSTPVVGFAIDFAFQGPEALKLVQQALASGEPYAMAFVDVRMPPGWDGIETIARIWQEYADLQVVICTAYSDYDWEDMINKLGQSDRMVILKKPFDNVEVLQLAHVLVEKWRLLQQTRQHTRELEATIAQRTAELRASEQRFRLLNDCSPVGIFETDARGDFLHANPRCLAIAGLASEAALRSGWMQLLHPEDAGHVVPAWRQAVASGQEFNSEYRFQKPAGEIRWVHAHTSPIRENLVIVGHVGTLVDITERKFAEAERKRMELQIHQGQKLESIGQLAAGIAHEINTPMQYIGDNTRFLQEAFTELGPAVTTAALPAAASPACSAPDLAYLLREIPLAIEQSLQGVERVTKIVRAMKEFSHPGTDEKTAIDLNYAIESTLTVARNEYKYVADLVTDFDPHLPPVPCLPGEFNQVILNLVINAAHAIADVVGVHPDTKGRIHIATHRQDAVVEVRITDSGTGIPEAVRGRIFDPFFTTKPVGKGSGQGLAIARSVVVDKHGGSLTFETELGRGTTFIIQLPLESPAAGSPGAKPATRPASIPSLIPADLQLLKTLS